MYRMKCFAKVVSCLALMMSSVMAVAEAPEAVNGARTVGLAQAKTLFDDGAVFIDVRDAQSWSLGHIEGSVNLLNTKLTLADLERVSPERSQEILFYCNGIRCLRSSDSIKKAKEWGYTNLIWFRGGWKEWTDKRLPVVVDK